MLKAPKHTESSAHASRNDKEPFFKPRVQAKLNVNQPGDSQEVEADKAADQIVNRNQSANPSPVQAKLQVQSKNEGKNSGVQLSEKTASKIQTSKGNGSPLKPKERREMESGFNADFSAVRIHNNADSAQMSENIQAKAFTHGNDIFFNQGKYNSDTKEGKHLLAHEQKAIARSNKKEKKFKP